MWDVIIAGAGPAGSIAAVMLARAARRVLLVDRARRGDRKFGETLPGAAALLLRGLDLPAPQIGGPHCPVGGNFFAWNSDTLVAADFINDLNGPAWRLDRSRFDEELRSAAVRAGAVASSAFVKDIQTGRSCWKILLDDGTIEQARWVIDATGRRSALANRLTLKQPAGNRLIALYTIVEMGSATHLNRTVVEAAPNGWWYAGRSPLGTPLIGFHTHIKEAKRLFADRCAWTEAFIKTQHVSSFLSQVTFARGLQVTDASDARLARFSGDRWVACGDAAMSFDPISGQGIFHALRSGIDAGAMVAKALDADDEGPNAYSRRLEDAWRHYRTVCTAIYRAERRWVDEPFWSMAACPAQLVSC